jgi:ElaB/YqjD/DUF883 family membrane-anchored ribosome-binding protein
MATREQSAPSGTLEATQEKGKELASQAGQQVQEKTHELRSEANVRLREQVDQRSTEAGEQVQSLAKALRQTSSQLRSEGKGTPARALEQVSEKAEDLGSYLRSTDADRIFGDLERFARRRPWMAAAAGATAGFIASRFLKASSERRYESNGNYRYSSPERRTSDVEYASSTRGLSTSGT